MSKSLDIVQINDVHGYMDLHQELFWQGKKAVFRPAGGYARIASLINQIRVENPGRVLFCDNGDTLHGTFPTVQTKGEILIPLLNKLGLDAMTVHWEFAYSPQVLKELAKKLDYPILAANVYDKQSGQTFLKPYTIKNVNGLKVGIIGLASNIVDKTMPASFSEGLTFTNGRDELPGLVAQLRSQGVNLIVLLSHLGFPQDVKMLSEVPGIDICLSGHTHNRLYRPVILGSSIIVQSGYHGSFLSHLKVQVEGQKLINFQHKLHEVTPDIPPDPMIAEMVETALNPFRAELSEVVGETSAPLHRGTSLESTMDNFLLESMLEATGAEVAFSNGWRYGAPIIPGPILVNDLYNIIPMNPPVSTVELSGEEILKMLEENLERTFSPDPFQQMGGYVKRCLGLTAYVRIENPNGTRIQKMFLGDDEVKPDRIYTAAFVTEQGVPLKYGANRQNIALKSVDAMRKYLALHRQLNIELHGTFIPV